jgi:hypothetical protein
MLHTSDLLLFPIVLVFALLAFKAQFKHFARTLQLLLADIGRHLRIGGTLRCGFHAADGVAGIGDGEVSSGTDGC